MYVVGGGAGMVLTCILAHTRLLKVCVYDLFCVNLFMRVNSLLRI